MYIVCVFFLFAFKIFSLSLVLSNLIMIWLGMVFFLCVWSLLSFLGVCVYISLNLENVIVISNVFLSSPYSLGTTVIPLLGSLKLSHLPLMFFSFFYYGKINKTNLL